MSKRENDFYYSFTSPPVPSSSSSSNATPSAPPTHDDLGPPTYDEATIPSSSTTEPSPPPNKSSLDGYVLDTSSPPFNPEAISMPMPIPQELPQHTADYGHLADQNTTSDNAPLLGETSEARYEEYDDFAGRPAPPGYSLYRAEYKVVKDGVVSRDAHINQDGEALLQFLYQHNKPPRMVIHFYGYHEETHWTTTTTRNNEGEIVEERQPTTRRIDDFNFDIDVSDDISPVCQGVYILPDPKTGDVKTLRELCDDYVHEHNVLKELQLTKEVNWDFNGLTRALTTAIRNSGFYENIEISFKMQNHQVVVKTDAAISRWIDNKAIRFFFFITFLWIFTWPVIWLFKKKFGHSTLKSSWNMNISERDWYGTHVQEVVNSCRGTNIFFRGGSKRPAKRPADIFSIHIF